MKEKIEDIITRLLANEASTDDEHTIIRWLEDNDENITEYASRERLWNAIEIVFKRKKYDPGAAFNKFKEKTRNHAGKKSPDPSAFTRMIRNYFRWAAIGLILIALGSFGTYFIIKYSGISGEKHYEVSSPPGSRSNITLADGTTVWLNAGSKLTYNGDFDHDNRSVYLEGEGYFNVKKDRDNPFTVITSQLEIVALGTSFNVKSYEEESIIQTTLVSGLVVVSRSKHKVREKGLVLEPNQQITYYKGSGEIAFTNKADTETESAGVKTNDEVRAEPIMAEEPKIVLSKGIDPEIFTSWKDNRLIFDNETFESIAVKLERRYGAKIIIEDEKIKTKKFKGRFDEITIEQALSALKFASHFDYYIKQDTIYITGQ